MRHRVSSFRSLLNLHGPFGFAGTERHLRRIVGIARRRGLWPVPRLQADDWSEPQLLAALEALEQSRASHLRYAAVFAERRRREKAEHRRQPTSGDLKALRRAEWLRDPAEAARRQPGTRGPRHRDPRPERPPEPAG